MQLVGPYFESMERMTMADSLPRNAEKAPAKKIPPFGARLKMTNLVIFDIVDRIPAKWG